MENAILFAVLLLGSLVAPACLGLALVYCLIALRDQDFGIGIPARPFLAVVPLLLIVVVGLPGFLSHGSYDSGKDLWYFVHPIVTIFFGYLWFRRNGKLGDLIDIYAFAGVALAFVSFYLIYANWTKIMLLGSLDQYRLLVGRGNLITVTAAGLLLLAPSRGFDDAYVLQHRWLKWLVLSICFVALAISFSRTLVVCMALGYLLSLSRKRAVKQFALLATAGALFVVGGVLFSVSKLPLEAGAYGDSFFSQFVSKVENSGAEVSGHPFQNTSEIENNWRGYETFRALKTFNAFDALHQFLGGGFGQLVDLGFEQKVYEFDFVRIPVIHNGYAYVLLKTGIAGEILLACFLVRCLLLFVQSRGAEAGSQESLMGLIALWLLLLIVLTQTVTEGLYAKLDYECVTCLVGVCFAGTERLRLRSRQFAHEVPSALAST